MLPAIAPVNKPQSAVQQQQHHNYEPTPPPTAQQESDQDAVVLPPVRRPVPHVVKIRPPKHRSLEERTDSLCFEESKQRSRLMGFESKEFMQVMVSMLHEDSELEPNVGLAENAARDTVRREQAREWAMLQHAMTANHKFAEERYKRRVYQLTADVIAQQEGRRDAIEQEQAANYSSMLRWEKLHRPWQHGHPRRHTNSSPLRMDRISPLRSGSAGGRDMPPPPLAPHAPLAGRPADSTSFRSSGRSRFNEERQKQWERTQQKCVFAYLEEDEAAARGELEAEHCRQLLVIHRHFFEERAEARRRQEDREYEEIHGTDRKGNVTAETRLRQRNRAALKIQCMVRCYFAIKERRRRFAARQARFARQALEHESAVKVQRCAWSFLGRRRLQRRKEQSARLRSQTMEEELRELHVRDIQAFLYGAVSRLHIKQKIQEELNNQSFYMLSLLTSIQAEEYESPTRVTYPLVAHTNDIYEQERERERRQQLRINGSFSVVRLADKRRQQDEEKRAAVEATERAQAQTQQVMSHPMPMTYLLMLRDGQMLHERLEFDSKYAGLLLLLQATALQERKTADCAELLKPRRLTSGLQSRSLHGLEILASTVTIPTVYKRKQRFEWTKLFEHEKAVALSSPRRTSEEQRRVRTLLQQSHFLALNMLYIASHPRTDDEEQQYKDESEINVRTIDEAVPQHCLEILRQATILESAASQDDAAFLLEMMNKAASAQADAAQGVSDVIAAKMNKLRNDLHDFWFGVTERGESKPSLSEQVRSAVELIPCRWNEYKDRAEFEVEECVMMSNQEEIDRDKMIHSQIAEFVAICTAFLRPPRKHRRRIDQL